MMKTIIDLNNLINALEASHRLKVHPETIKRLIRQGDLAAVKLGNVWFIEKGELESFASTYTGERGAPKKRER